MGIRSNILPHIYHLIGNDEFMNFWKDPWLSGGWIIDQYGKRVAYNIRFGLNIKVDRFIKDGHLILYLFIRLLNHFLEHLLSGLKGASKSTLFVRGCLKTKEFLSQRNVFFFFWSPIVFYAMPHGNPVLICSCIVHLPLTYGTVYSENWAFCQFQFRIQLR